MDISIFSEVLTAQTGPTILNSQLTSEEPKITIYSCEPGIDKDLDFWKDTCCGESQNPACKFILGFFPYNLIWEGVDTTNRETFEWDIIRKVLQIVLYDSEYFNKYLDLQTITRQYTVVDLGIFSDIFFKSEITGSPDIRAFTQFLETGANIMWMLPDKLDIPCRYNFYATAALGAKVLLSKLKEGLKDVSIH